MEQNQNSPALFKDRSQEMMAQADAAGVARATQEVQAALVIAMRNPRDEIKAETRIMQACQRKSLAEVAEYEYSRGGTRITGPTIDLLRAIANRWGNLTFGWSEVERGNGQSTVRCWAWDLQYNSKAERSFVVRHWRDTQAGGYAIEDERDIYELLANMASRRVRACLEEVIDADIVDKAVDQCHRTLKDGETIPLKDRATKMVLAFAGQGITKEMIEKRLGNTLEAVSENQLASLRRIFKALVDGVGKREDYFKPTAVAPNFGAAQGTMEQAPIYSPSFPAEASPVAPVVQNEVPVMQTAVPVAQPATPSNLRILRDMLRISKVKEGQLLDFLAGTGATDGSFGTLEEVAMTSPNVIQLSIKNFADIVGKINAAS